MVRATIIKVNDDQQIYLDIQINKKYTGKKRIEEIQKLSGKEVLVVISITEDPYHPPYKTRPLLHYKLIAEIFDIDESAT